MTTKDDSSTALHGLQAEVHSLVEAVGATAYVIDTTGVEVAMLSANSRAIAGLARAVAKTDARTLADFWQRDGLAPAVGAFRQSVQSGEAVPFPACLVDGLGLAIPLRDAAGEARTLVIETPSQPSPRADRGPREPDPRLMGLVHDARNLIIPLVGWAELMVAGQTAPERAGENMAEAAAMIADLLEEFMAALLGEETPGAADPGAAIAELEGLLRALLGERIDLTMRLAPDTPRVRVSVGRLKQIVLNLVINARDAMPSGGVVVITLSRARGSATDAGGAAVLISVADDGPGMDPATRERALAPFASRSNAQGRRGIGLWAVADIVRRAGGDIAIQSEPGSGTTVDVLLPVNST